MCVLRARGNKGRAGREREGCVCVRIFSRLQKRSQLLLCKMCFYRGRQSRAINRQFNQKVEIRKKPLTMHVSQGPPFPVSRAVESTNQDKKMEGKEGKMYTLWLGLASVYVVCIWVK